MRSILVFVLGMTLCGPIALAQNAREEVRTNPAFLDVYVSAKYGNDSWSGRFAKPNCNTPGCAPTDGPFATFNRAQAFVETVIAAAPPAEIHIKFASGTYYLIQSEKGITSAAALQPALLTSLDSGSPTTEIFYENYPGESPVISGGLRLQEWTNPSGDNVTWQMTLPSATTANFENLFYNGVRRLRPRLSSAATSASSAYLGTYFRVLSPLYSSVAVPGCDQPKAYFPDLGGYECFDRFQYSATDPISGAWKNLNPPAPDPANPNTCDPPNGSKALVGDIELVDFEKYYASKLRISCVDTTNHYIYLTGSTGFEQDHPTASGFIAGHRYLIENVQDDLTQPGQWFLDRSPNSAQTWTLTLLTNPGENPNIDEVIIPQLPQVLVGTNLQHMTFRGMTFAHDNVVVSDKAAPNGGYGGSAAVIAAVSFQNSSHIRFDRSIVTQTSGAGLEFISCIDSTSPNWCVTTSSGGGTADNVVENSAFYDLGANGLRIGSSGQASDTEANVPQFNKVRDTVIAGYGRVYPGSTGIQQGQGHDNEYTHNEVYDGYKGAIHVCFCSDDAPTSGLLPSDNTISFNLVHDLFQGIMNDSGSLYFGVGTPNTDTGGIPASGTGNAMLDNVVHDVSDASALDSDGYGGDGLYLDDFTGGVDLERNLVYRVSGNALSFSGPRAGAGQQSTVTNNIFAFARTSMINAYDPYSFGIVPPAANPLFFVASENLFYFDRSDSSPAIPFPAPFYVQGGCTYAGGGGTQPQVPYTNYQQWNNNLYWRTDGAFAGYLLAFRVQPKTGANSPCVSSTDSTFLTLEKFYTFAGWQSIGEDTNSLVRRPGFKHPAYPDDDYSMPDGSPLPGFVIFDPHHAGRRNPVINLPPVFSTFPTAPFNPATDF